MRTKLIKMLVKIIKLVKNEGQLNLLQANINGLGEGWKADRRHKWAPRELNSNHLYSSSCNRGTTYMCSMTLSSFDHPLMLSMECGIARDDYQMAAIVSLSHPPLMLYNVMGVFIARTKRAGRRLQAVVHRHNTSQCTYL